MDPEMEQAATAPSANSATPMPDQGEVDAGDTGPLEAMHITPAEDGGSVVEHHPKVPERAKAMDHPAVKVRKHVVKNHDELVEHIKKHGKRLKP